MKLELKDLAPYLPYGLKIKTNNQIRVMSVAVLTTTENSISNIIYGVGHKPILRPLSDLTKEINIDGDYFIPIYLLKNIRYEFESDLSFGFDPQSDGYTCHCSSQYLEFSEYYEINSKLFEWHFDVFGLIEKGLAIDINTI
tara:strand:- start:75 stop:497 length:423 start_codon:yes stop_codon:yes gene_type:complete